MSTPHTEIVEGLLRWWGARFGIVTGSRNANLYKLAAALNNYGIPQVAALDVCLRYVDPTGTDPLTAREITATVASAYRRTEHGVKEWAMGNQLRVSPPRRTLSEEQARAVEDRLVEMLRKQWPTPAPLPGEAPTPAPPRPEQGLDLADYLLSRSAGEQVPTPAPEPTPSPLAAFRIMMPGDVSRRRVVVRNGRGFASEVIRMDGGALSFAFGATSSARALVLSEMEALIVLDSWRGADMQGPSRCMLFPPPLRLDPSAASINKMNPSKQ